MDLHYYKPTDTEKWISEKYQENGIRTAADMDMDIIADMFNAAVQLTKTDEPRVLWDDDFCLILLDRDAPMEKIRKDFFHEICHPMFHIGNQHLLPVGLMELQENQADALQFYTAMPSYLLREFQGIQTYREYVKTVSDAFMLPPKFVEQRIAQIQRRSYIERSDREINAPSVSVQFDYMPETKRILAQLKRQLSTKNGVVTNG